MSATSTIGRPLATTLAAAAIVLTAAASVHAHVQLDSPNGGESLVGGSTFTLEWQPLVTHGPRDWDLWYSTTSADGPWTSIAENLFPGDPVNGGRFSHLWSVPSVDADDAWVRVRQDNESGEIYYDVSDASFAIAALPALRADYNGNGIVDAADYTVWRDTLGQTGVGLAADGDGNDKIDQGDYDVWKLDFGQAIAGGAASLGANAVPEPTSSLLCLVGLALAALRRRRSVFATHGR